MRKEGRKSGKKKRKEIKRRRGKDFEIGERDIEERGGE